MEILPNSYGVSVYTINSGWLDSNFAILLHNEEKACLMHVQRVQTDQDLESFISFSEGRLGDLAKVDSYIAGGNYRSCSQKEGLDAQREIINNVLLSNNLRKIEIFPGKEDYVCKLIYNCNGHKIIVDEKDQKIGRNFHLLNKLSPINL